MAKQSGRHGASRRFLHPGPNRRAGWNSARGFNRGDLAIFVCGILGFFSLTFGGPLLNHLDSGNHLDAGNHGAVSVPAAESHALTLAPPSAIPWPLSRTGEAAAAAPALTSTPTPVATPAVTGPALPAASAPQRILYPAAAIDTAVHALEPDAAAAASRTVVPPATMDGYWLSPFGVPGKGSGNTTYIIGHSWEDRDAPFNHLSSSAAVGDEFNVITATGTIRYRVDNVTTYVKAGLKDSPIWEMVPNRVVLISCYTEDPWGKNVVVTASPAAG